MTVRGVLGVAGLLATGSPAVAAGTGGEPSPLILPPQQIPLRFDHARHLGMGLGCAECHASAPRSISSADSLIPREDSCRAGGCHDIDRTKPGKQVEPGKGPARCDACHAGWSGPGEPPRVVIPRPSLKFNHRIHVDRGVGCLRCHASVAEATLATRGDLPRMPRCLECHDGRRAEGHAPGRCTTCHLARSDGRIDTDLAGGRLAPSGVLRGFDAHGPDFRVRHKQAGKDEAYCLNCHKRTECTDCHGAGVVKPFDIHPADYVSIHAVDARRNAPDCSSCHRLGSFCVACHQRSGVASDPESGLPGQKPRNPFGTGSQVKSFHPAGWVRDAAGAVIFGRGPDHHSFQAKRNIRSCASCHREETCIECHSADFSRTAVVSPHGPGRFADSARCRALAARNRRVCLKCHAPGAAELDCR